MVLTTIELDATLRNVRDNYPSIIDKLNALGTMLSGCIDSEADQATIATIVATEIARRQSLPVKEQDSGF